MKLMKLSILLLLVLVVFNPAVCQQANASADGQCSTNPFIATLKAKGLVTYKTPVQNSEYCAAEWGNHGTCCEVKSLKKIVEAERLKSIYLGEFIAVEIKQSITAMTHFLIRHGFRYRHYKFITFFNKKKKNAKKDATDKYIYGELTKMINKYKKSKNNMIKSQKKCLKKLHEVRSGSHCFTCSSRSNFFFDEHKRMRLHENTCREIVSDCTDAWLYLIELVDYMTKFREFVLQVEQLYHIPKAFRQPVPHLDGIASFLKETNVKASLEHCRRGKCSFNSVKSVCDTFVSINGPVYLEVALKHFPKTTAFNFAKFKIDSRAAFRKAGSKIKGFFQKLFKKKGRKLSARGRNLLLAKATTTTVKTASTTTTTPTTTLSSTTTSATQSTTTNPLLCSTSVCTSDKVIVTASDCGSLTSTLDSRCTCTMSFP